MTLRPNRAAGAVDLGGRDTANLHLTPTKLDLAGNCPATSHALAPSCPTQPSTPARTCAPT